MDIIDYFNKIQNSMVKTFNKSYEKLNKTISKNYKKPSCEISQSKDGIMIRADLLGMVKKDVSLHITHDYLEIFAKKDKKAKRKVMGYRRVVQLPPGLITDKINAKFKNGKLTVKIPKVKIGKVIVK